MESNRNYGSMKSMLAAGLIGLAAAGCGAEFTTGNVETADAGGNGGAAGHDGGTDATGGKAGAGGNEGGADVGGGDTGGGDAGGAGGQPCEYQFDNLNGGGEYVDKGQQNVKMLCLTVTAGCESVLNGVTVDEEYLLSPTNGILSKGKLWINDQLVKEDVFPVSIDSGTNRIVFGNVDNTMQNGSMTKVCAGGDIKANAGGNAKLVARAGDLKTTPASSSPEMGGNPFTVNP
jgi:hypothetical protein